MTQTIGGEVPPITGRHLDRVFGPHTPKLPTLTLGRVQLTWQQPSTELALTQGELVLYPLIGTVEAGVVVEAGHYGVSRLGSREKVPGEAVAILRCLSDPQHTGRVTVQVSLTGTQVSADLLVMHTTAMDTDAFPYTHFLVQWQPQEHLVGSGTHRRTVREYHVPPGFLLHVGETVNIPGGWSSWPSHASPYDEDQFARKAVTHEEVMFFLGEEPGLAVLKGMYSDGTLIDECRVLQNGTAHIMPLGSHAIVAHPGSALTYIWAYVGTALKKQYNMAADDVKVYVK